MTQVPASSHGGPAFNGGTITQPLVIDTSGGSGNDIPLQLRVSWNAQGVDCFSVYNVDTGHDAMSVDSGTNLLVQSHTSGATVGAIGGTGQITAVKGYATQVIGSGALPTWALSSGVASQNPSAETRDIHVVVPFTGDATNNAATLKIELSPDNLTFSILDTLSIAAALNLTGAINEPVSLFVPATWYVKLTAVHGTIGTATYY